MAPRKRPRDANDVDVEVEIESASSAFRQHLPKRSRVTIARENGGSVISDDDDDDTEELASLMAATPHADNTPTDSSDSEDEEIDQRQATQVLEKQASLRDARAGNLESEQGVIEEVYCRNFMCHTKLRIKLGPLINFIIGHNGSGKSAVLTALTMCLGGKATATNRGTSLKNLIKEGEDSATLAVRIKNQGDGAYRPELYGNSIVVERHFTRSGTSGFKLKNAQDKVISTKKADLDDILDFFAFQLDNPINVLTQDMARQFLSNSTPSDKYKFFIRGTQLEVLDADYKLLEEHLDGIMVKLHTRKQDIAHLKSVCEEAERKKQRAQQISTIEQRMAKLQSMHAWAQVEEVERDVEKQNQAVSKAESKVQELQDEAESEDSAFEGHNQSWEAAQRNLAEYAALLESATDDHVREKEQFDANKAQLLQHKAEERTMKVNINKAKADVQKYEQAIKTEEQRLIDAEGPEHAQRLEQLEILKENFEQAKRNQMEHGTGIAELERKKGDAEQQWEAAKPQLKQRNEELRKAQARLSGAKDQQPRPFDGYRPNMENLVRQINRETRWRSKPIGPMGHHIKLLKQEWSSQIERTFGGVLDSFIVTNKEDADMLHQIMRRTNCTPAVNITSAPRLDTTGKEPQSGVDTILRVIEIDHDAVRNELIINQAIEQTVLIKNRKDAERFAWDGPRPHNVRSVMCHDDHDSRKGWRFEWSKSGAPKTSPVRRWETAQRIQSNRERQIASYEEDVKQAGQDLKSAEDLVKQLQDTAVKARQEVAAFNRRQKDLRVAIQSAEDEVTAMKQEIEASRPEDGKMQELERSLAEARDELNAGESSFMDMVNAKDRLTDIASEIKQRLDAAQATLDQATKRVRTAEKRKDEIEVLRQEALRAKNVAHRRIEEAKGVQARAESDRDEEKQRLDEFIEAASQICARVPVDAGVTPDILDQRLTKLTEEKERAMREAGGTIEELHQAYLEAKRDFNQAARQWKEMNVFADTLRQSLSYRHYRWKMFRKYISHRARINFGYLLSERQFRGHILLDHRARELDIKVEPDLSKQSAAGRQAKTLSGGEKSFSTICLLLSIWEAMGSPIRCLDEFDVFMDSVNRAQSTNMMIAAARRSVGRQFILITPQSMANVDMAEDVRVHKMSDPERGQTVLPFGATQAR